MRLEILADQLSSNFRLSIERYAATLECAEDARRQSVALRLNKGAQAI